MLIIVYCARKSRDRKVYIDVVFADHSILCKDVHRQDSLYSHRRCWSQYHRILCKDVQRQGILHWHSALCKHVKRARKLCMLTALLRCICLLLHTCVFIHKKLCVYCNSNRITVKLWQGAILIFLLCTKVGLSIVTELI